MQNISLKITKIANEADIDLSDLEIKLLSQKQDIIFKQIEFLHLEINRLSSDGVSTMNQLHNVTIYADPSKPPISVVLLLKLLKNQGYKVACQSYCKKTTNTPIQIKISEYLKTNLDIVNSREQYDLIVSIIWKDMEISEVLCYDNIVDAVPLIGEMTALAYICFVLNIDVLSFMDKIECLNSDLMYKHNVKSALNLLNNKLANNINNSNASNSFLSTFAISCLVQSAVMDKASSSLKMNIDKVLNDCGRDANEICNLF